MNNTINFFKEIALIPRESGNEEKIADYLTNFAKKRGLTWYKDKYNNVLIKKINKNLPCLILQAHMDMVCVSKDANFNFNTNPIKVIEKDGYLYANDTSLGADNGIGVAQILNILDSNIPCNIEALFTTSEETTMIGAKNFDVSLLNGNYLINLDGFDENTILTESAAYYDLVMDSTSLSWEYGKKNNTYLIKLEGLLGGHSGYDINKNAGNAILLVAEFLKLLDGNLVSIKSGTKNNVFPSSATAIIATDINNIEEITKQFLDKYHFLYPKLNISYKKVRDEQKYLKNTKEFLDFLTQFPSKAINYDENKRVTTSINLGVINNTHLEIGLRSSREKEALKALENLNSLACKYSFKLSKEGYQPGFYMDKNAKLITLLAKSSPYKNKPHISIAHISTEVGFMKEKMPNLEIAIISPKIRYAHSIRECVSIDSIYLVDKWLEKFIIQFNEFFDN